MLAPLLLSVFLAQVELGPLLDRGPLVLVEQDARGRFDSATSHVHIRVAPERVWDAVVHVEAFRGFMPKVLTSEVVRRGEKDFDVRFVIDVPGPDTDYVVRFTPDPATRTLTGHWVKGDLKGSRWRYSVQAAPDGTALLVHTLAVKNFSAMAQSLEDDAQTITIGLNVSSVLAASRALKQRAEGPAADAGRSPPKSPRALRFPQ